MTTDDSSFDSENAIDHVPAGGADADFVADLFADHRRAHRGLVGDLAVAGARLGRHDERPGLGLAGVVDDGDAATDADSAVALARIDELGMAQGVLDLADTPVKAGDLLFRLGPFAAVGGVAVGLVALQALLDL